MFGLIIGAIAGAAIGGVVNGVTAYASANKKADEYQKYADTISAAADKYSGTNAYNYEKDMGRNYASDMTRFVDTRANLGPSNPGNVFSPIQSSLNGGAAAETMNAYEGGYRAGQTNAQTEMDAKYNAELAKAGVQRNQADIDYNVTNQTAQAALGGIGTVANTGRQIASNRWFGGGQ